MKKEILVSVCLIAMVLLFSGCTQFIGGGENQTVNKINLEKAIDDCEDDKTDIREHTNEYVYKSIKGMNAGLDNDMDELIGLIQDLNEEITDNMVDFRDDLNIVRKDLNNVNNTMIDINIMINDIDKNINDIEEMVEDL